MTTGEREAPVLRVRWRETIEGTADFVVTVTCHLVGAVVVVTAIWAFSRWFHYLWAADDPLLFNTIPYRFTFDAADVAVIVGFIFRAYRELID